MKNFFTKNVRSQEGENTLEGIEKKRQDAIEMLADKWKLGDGFALFLIQEEPQVGQAIVCMRGTQVGAFVEMFGNALEQSGVGFLEHEMIEMPNYPPDDEILH